MNYHILSNVHELSNNIERQQWQNRTGCTESPEFLPVLVLPLQVEVKVIHETEWFFLVAITI